MGDGGAGGVCERGGIAVGYGGEKCVDLSGGGFFYRRVDI